MKHERFIGLTHGLSGSGIIHAAPRFGVLHVNQLAPPRACVVCAIVDVRRHDLVSMQVRGTWDENTSMKTWVCRTIELG